MIPHSEASARHMAEAELPNGKTLDTLGFAAVPTIHNPRIKALGRGDGQIERSANLLMFGASGVGKNRSAEPRNEIGLALA